MNVFSSLMTIISALLSVYMLMVMIRILLTWFRSNLHSSRAVQILTQIVDPYLNIFRRVTWLRAGQFDFSPIIAMMVLGLLVQMTSTLAQTGRFTVTMLISYIIVSLWSFISFLLWILIILMIVRLVSLFLKTSSHQFWFIVDNILNRVMAKILGIFTSKPMSFRNALILCGLILIAVALGMRIGVSYLVHFLNSL